jgi:hypothetical protein
MKPGSPRLPRAILGAPFGPDCELLSFLGRVIDECKLASAWANGTAVDDNETTGQLLLRLWEAAWKKCRRTGGEVPVIEFDRMFVREVFRYCGQITGGDEKDHHR